MNKGFIYETTNNVTGKKYIGKKYYYDRNGKETNWKKYLGSSKLLKEDIKHYGESNFSREILEEADTVEALALLEKHYIDAADAVFNEGYYNLTNKVDKFFTTTESIERGLRTRERWSDEKRAAVSDRMKQSWADNYDERCKSMKGKRGANFSKVRSKVQTKVMAEMDDATKQAINTKRSASAKKHRDTLTEDQKQAHVDKRKHAIEKMHAATKAKKIKALQREVCLININTGDEQEMTIEKIVLDYGINYAIIRQMLTGKYGTSNNYKKTWTVKTSSKKSG